MTRPLKSPTAIDLLKRHGKGIESLARRPATTLGPGIYECKVFDDDEIVVTGDNAFEWMIPADLDDAVLVEVEAFVTTVSSSGAVSVQIANERIGASTVDMLSTNITIDANEKNTVTAATPAVINTANATVTNGDHIRVDVDSAGTGAQGLGVILRFIPNAVYQVVVTGSTGPTGAPGGITAWEGAWVTSTSYQTSDAVSHNGASYAARQDHTSGASSEPGVGASWETYWMLLAEPASTGADGWTPAGDTWTYASATTFTISGVDRTATFTKGTRLKLTQTSAKYFVVVSSSFSTNTTVTITGGTDYTLANASITSPYYSYAVNPQGYPGAFAYTPVFSSSGGGASIGNGTVVGRFSVVGTRVQAEARLTAGSTTNFGSGLLRLTLPITGSSTSPQSLGNGQSYLSDSGGSDYFGGAFVYNSGTPDYFGAFINYATAPGGVYLTGTTPVTLGTSDAWTATLSYEMA